MLRKILHKLKNQKGQSFLEFAIVAPFMMFIFLFVIDIGRFQIAKWDVMNTARDTARWMSLQESGGAPTKDSLKRAGICTAKNFFRVTRTAGIFESDVPEVDAYDGGERGQPIAVTVCGTVKPLVSAYNIDFYGDTDEKNKVCYTYAMYRNLASQKQGGRLENRDKYSMGAVGKC